MAGIASSPDGSKTAAGGEGGGGGEGVTTQEVPVPVPVPVPLTTAQAQSQSGTRLGVSVHCITGEHASEPHMVQSFR